MGVDIADINNDALLDIFVVDMVAEDNYRLKSNMSGMTLKGFGKLLKIVVVINTCITHYN